MEIKKGLNSFQIKMIALFFMVLDHIHYTLSTFNIPILFNILGRISAPLFLFISTIGIIHTRSPKKYLLRLWLGFVFMNIGNSIINKFFPLPNGGIIMNNIFSTLFCMCFIIYCIDSFRKNKKNIKYLFLMLLPILSRFLMIALISKPEFSILFKIFFYTIPNCIFCEGGFIFVILGIIFYIFKDNKKNLCISYIIFCILILLLGYNSSAPLESMFIWNIQYFMILALPFLMLYNGEKGKDIKYFFYIFYPAHIYLLTILAFFLDKLKN